jgi:hypothetical protein
MNRTQKYISILLERLPKYELRSYDHQTTLDRIRDRIAETPDIHAELRRLYTVKNCADFAMSLMWIAENVEKDPTKEESTIDEETLVFDKFRHAMGEEAPPEVTPAAEGMGSAPTSERALPFDLSKSQKEKPLSVPEQHIEEIFSAMAQPSLSTPPVSGGGEVNTEQELRFAGLLEKLLESVQSGSDDRTKLLSDVLHECTIVISSGSSAQDYKHFSNLLSEFLQYISKNQYMDDVRVMNILSNIQDPFAQWAHGKQEERAEFLVSINDILRDFKTMFE